MMNNQNDSANFSDQQFDALMRDADPGRRAPPVDNLQRQWVSLAAGRRRRQRLVRFSMFATAACLLLAVGLLLRSPLPETQVASNSSAKSADPESTQMTEALATAVDSIAESPTSSVEMVQPTEPANLPAPPPKLIDQFRQALAKIESRDQRAWYQLVIQLRQMPLALQRELVQEIPKLEDASVRLQAMAVVSDAAAGDAVAVWLTWLKHSATRDHAWKKLVGSSQPSDWKALSVLARHAAERDLLCSQMVTFWNSGGTDGLIEMAQQPQWRQSVSAASRKLDAQATMALIDQIDNGSITRRAAAAFVLASMDGPQIDQGLMQMIVQGRRRLAAYQALIARDTPEARQFLVASANRYDLSPALAAARRRSNVWGPQAFQWVSKTRVRNDVQDKLLLHDVLSGNRLAVVLLRSAWPGCNGEGCG